VPKCGCVVQDGSSNYCFFVTNCILGNGGIVSARNLALGVT
jgi:hypothetical protein